jgi:hypothetical protein
MTQNMQKGDLVWIPQHAQLHWLREGGDKRYLITDAPRTAVVCDQNDRSYDVFLEGKMWTINKMLTYHVEGEYAR